MDTSCSSGSKESSIQKKAGDRFLQQSISMRQTPEATNVPENPCKNKLISIHKAPQNRDKNKRLKWQKI